MQAWDTNTTLTNSVDSLAHSVLITLDAEPVFAEIGEKVRELTATLHEKIINQELQWSLMMTSLGMVKQLRTMCDNEISRRELEYKEYADSKEQGMEEAKTL